MSRPPILSILMPTDLGSAWVALPKLDIIFVDVVFRLSETEAVLVFRALRGNFGRSRNAAGVILCLSRCHSFDRTSRFCAIQHFRSIFRRSSSSTATATATGTWCRLVEAATRCRHIKKITMLIHSFLRSIFMSRYASVCRICQRLSLSVWPR